MSDPNLDSLITQVSKGGGAKKQTTDSLDLSDVQNAVNEIQGGKRKGPNPDLNDVIDEESGLLGKRKAKNKNKKCLVLDLDETLVHSSFKKVNNPSADFLVPVDIDGVVHTVYVLKRPGTDEFLQKCSEMFEIVLFTASLSKYADPLLDMLDTKKTIDTRLFRDSCVQKDYCYVKDLSKLGRHLKDCIIVDNSPQSYIFHPENAIPIPSWFDDSSDTALTDLIPVLKQLSECEDIREQLNASKHSFQWLLKKYHKYAKK